MAVAVSETKKGMWELENDVRIIRDDLPDAVVAELDEIWQKIKDMAIELCPKESGALASSIELESEGGSGKISSGTTQGAEFYHNAIYAGNDSTFNAHGQPTSQYAQSVHDGHILADGNFWEGTPFLEDALDAFEDELSLAVSRGLNDLGIGDSSNASTDRLGDGTE